MVWIQFLVNFSIVFLSYVVTFVQCCNGNEEGKEIFPQSGETNIGILRKH